MTPTPSASAQDLNPHARGDDFSAFMDYLGGFPQPPRTWGRRQRGAVGETGRASTPTHVGTTDRGPLSTADTSLNPHARGDDGRSPIGL